METVQQAVISELVGGASWDVIKLAFKRTLHAARRLPGWRDEGLLTSDGDLSDFVVQQLYEAYAVAQPVVAEGRPVDHSVLEAQAFQLALFNIELRHAEGWVHLGPHLYRRLAVAGSAKPEELTPPQLAKRLVAEWFAAHPNAEAGGC